MSIAPWQVKNSHVMARTKIFDLMTRTAVSPRTGREHDFYLLKAGNWVNIIPITPDQKVILVRQYRHGTDKVTLEIPGGLVESEQTPEEAARCELREETGYSAPDMRLLGRVRPNPAFLNNWCYSYLAEGAVKTAEKDLDDAEDLEVVTADLAHIPDLIVSGEINHSLVLSAFFLYMNKER